MAAHIQVQFAWGSSAEVATYVGADREVVVDISNRWLVIMDGITPGGTKQASQTWVTQQLGAQTNSVAANLFLHSTCR